MSAYLPHQIRAASETEQLLRQHGLAYIFGEPRSGKTRTALKIAHDIGAKNVLVLTPKAAISGWEKEQAAVGYNAPITVTNYEQAPKLRAEYDLVIIDEAHRLGKVGKPTQRVKDIRAITGNARCLYLSGTPIVETPLAIYYQWIVCRHTPLRFKNFYEFFRHYGVPSMIRLHGRWVEQYKKSKPELLEKIEPYIVRMTQADAGIPDSVQARDKLHVVSLERETHKLIKTIQEDKVASIAGEVVAFDSDIKERMAVHQVECGALRIDDQIVELANNEVIEYLLRTFGDSTDVALMAHFHSTRQKLERHFKRAHIYSSTAHAEGVDLSHYRHFVIVNADYSGAKFVQRRERLVNVTKTGESVVHHIVTNGGVSSLVYEMTSKKRDFNLKCYRELRDAERTGGTKEDH